MSRYLQPPVAAAGPGLPPPMRGEPRRRCGCAWCDPMAAMQWSLHDTLTTSEALFGFSESGRFVGSETYLLMLPVYHPAASENDVRVIDHEHKLGVVERRERAARRLRARVGAHTGRLVGQSGQILSADLQLHELDGVPVRRRCGACGKSAPLDGSACVYCGQDQS